MYLILEDSIIIHLWFFYVLYRWTLFLKINNIYFKIIFIMYTVLHIIFIIFYLINFICMPISIIVWLSKKNFNE